MKRKKENESLVDVMYIHTCHFGISITVSSGTGLSLCQVPQCSVRHGKAYLSLHLGGITRARLCARRNYTCGVLFFQGVVAGHQSRLSLKSVRVCTLGRSCRAWLHSGNRWKIDVYTVKYQSSTHARTRAHPLLFKILGNSTRLRQALTPSFRWRW